MRNWVPWPIPCIVSSRVSTSCVLSACVACQEFGSDTLVTSLTKIKYDHNPFLLFSSLLLVSLHKSFPCGYTCVLRVQGDKASQRPKVRCLPDLTACFRETGWRPLDRLIIFFKLLEGLAGDRLAVYLPIFPRFHWSTSSVYALQYTVII